MACEVTWRGLGRVEEGVAFGMDVGVFLLCLIAFHLVRESFEGFRYMGELAWPLSDLEGTLPGTRASGIWCELTWPLSELVETFPGTRDSGIWVDFFFNLEGTFPETLMGTFMKTFIGILRDVLRVTSWGLWTFLAVARGRHLRVFKGVLGKAF